MKKLILVSVIGLFLFGCGEDEVKYSSVTITSVTITKYDQYRVYDGKNYYWDASSGLPDPYLVLFDEDLKELSTSGYLNNIGVGDLPKTMNINYTNKMHTIYDLSKRYAIMIRDYDGSTSDFEVMGFLELPIYSYIGSYPTTVFLSGCELGTSSALTVSLKWNK